LNATADAVPRFVPVIVTDVPTGPPVGEKPEIAGAAVEGTVKFVVLVAVPSGVVTPMSPVVALGGTVAISWVAEVTLNVALTPLNVMAIAPVKFAPVIVTSVPTGPLVGVKVEMVGAARTVNAAALVAVPPGVVTFMVPLVAPAGTVAVIWVAEITVNAAAMSLSVTAVAPVKSVPPTVITVPIDPLAGANVAMVGAGVATEYEIVWVAALPAASTALTVNVLNPAEPVSIEFPLGTGPSHDRMPDNASAHV
jgi:hypothetical protein